MYKESYQRMEKQFENFENAFSRFTQCTGPQTPGPKKSMKQRKHVTSSALQRRKCEALSQSEISKMTNTQMVQLYDAADLTSTQRLCWHYSFTEKNT